MVKQIFLLACLFSLLFTVPALAADNPGTFGSSGTVPFISADTATDGTAATALGFQLNGTEMMRVTATGSVGIGTTTPAVALHVYDDAILGATGKVQPDTLTTNGWAFYKNGYGMCANDNGGCLILGKNNGAVNLDYIYFLKSGAIVGYITVGSGTLAYNSVSDRRLKENIKPSNRGIETLMHISVSEFNIISDEKKKQTQGFIAQDLIKNYPEAVTTNGDNGITALQKGKAPWAVDYGRLTPLLVKSVQELKSENDALRVEIKAKDDAFAARLEKLEARVK